MGEPAELSLEDIAASVKLAKEVVESVRNDTPFPLTGMSREDQGRVLTMAQTLRWCTIIDPNASLKRIAWAYGCSKKGSDEEAKLKKILLAKAQAETGV